MLFLALPVVAGVVLALVAGGDLRRWHTTRLDYRWPAFCALATQLAIFDPPLERASLIITFGPIIYLASMAVILLVIGHNARRQPGRARSLALWVAALGVALNCAVVAANGGYMPRAAVGSHSAVVPPVEAERLVNVAPMTPETRLVWLGDILEEPAWVPLSNVLSIGDVLLAAGLGSWAFAVTVAGQPRFARRAKAEWTEVVRATTGA